MHLKHIKPKFGELYFADLQASGSVQGGRRPVLIVSNDTGNYHSTIVEIVPLSSRVHKADHMPTHVTISANDENGLASDSVALAEQVQTINQSQLRAWLGRLAHGDLVQIGRARRIQSPFPES